MRLFYEDRFFSQTRLPGHDNGPQWSVCNANTRQLRPLLQIFCKLQPCGASLQHAIPFDTPTCRDVLPFVGKPEMPQSY
ncbi:uncharacterized protein [Dermacentor albipictus]|uniref:uncharacterized protein isoform X6 n=1 Tax=Dermacentor albipictus TaxID=60249 RepID=UPI0031FD0BD6